MRQNLAEWESSLEPYFEHIKLLGEIPITHIELEQLENLIRELIKVYGQAKATRKLEDDYPKTYAVLLAAIAAHNTDRDYWRVVSEALNIPIQRMSQLHWGEIFLGNLREFNLPSFETVGGYRFVTPIRLHGGIPAYSLPDFLAYILWPSVKKDIYKGLTTEKVIPILLKRTAVQIAVDSPVTNFLDNGGEYAVDFLDRCRKMARIYIQSQEIPDASELGLPPYVVRTFQQWVDEELETERGKRLRAPRLFLDPWGPDFYLYLPPETVEGLMANRSYFWHITKLGRDRKVSEHTERVRVRRRGYDLETSAVELPIENHSTSIVASYCCKEAAPGNPDEEVTHTLRRWRMDLLPSSDQLPLLVFHPKDGRILRWNQSLPAEELWLLFPSEFDLQIMGEGQATEYFPQYTGNSGMWNVQSWDLRKAHAVQLIKNGKGVSTPIPVISAPPDPILVGENLLESNVDPDDIPLFVGSPPWIRIPLRPGRSPASEVEQWKLIIDSRYAASPAIHNELYQLSSITPRQEEATNTIDLPLAAILGDQVCGTYRLVVIGPYDIRTEFRFRVWPEMTLLDLEPYYLPDKDGPQKVCFSIYLTDGCEVQPQAGAEGISVRRYDEYFQVMVNPDITVADLHLVSQIPNEDPIRLPIYLAVPRLRWSLLLGEEDTDIKWTASLVKSTVGALLQSEHRTLFIDFPLVDELPLTINVHLLDPENGKVLQEHMRPQQVLFRKTRWRFPLGEFSDTIRQMDQIPVFDFQLAIQNTQTGEMLKLPVLRLNRELEITNVKIDFIDKNKFQLQWSEPKPLRNRRVCIWSEWQPWLAPVEIKLPDDTHETYLVTGMELPPSYYRIHFFTAAPWEEIDLPALPLPDSHLVEAISPRKMLDWIKGKIVSQPDHFLLHFLSACVLEANGDIKGRDKEIEWCYRNLESATPKTILAYYYWLGGEQSGTQTPRDLNSQKAVRISMLRPNNIRRMLQSHTDGDQVRATYLEVYTEIDLITPESALMVLENDNDPRRTIHSMQILIKRQSPEVLKKIIDLMEDGQLSDSDAGELLSLNTSFSLPGLDKLVDSPTKLRLIKRMVKLIPEQDYFVLPEFWIRTNAGWGCIQNVFDEENGQELQYFNLKADKPKISVVLRPDKYPERIEIDLAAKTITFLDAKQVYICIKDNCNYFASENMWFVRNEHNHASHMGIGPAFSPVNPTLQMSMPEIYSLEPPENQFA